MIRGPLIREPCSSELTWTLPGLYFFDGPIKKLLHPRILFMVAEWLNILEARLPNLFHTSKEETHRYIGKRGASMGVPTLASPTLLTLQGRYTPEHISPYRNKPRVTVTDQGLCQQTNRPNVHFGAYVLPFDQYKLDEYLIFEP